MMQSARLSAHLPCGVLGLTTNSLWPNLIGCGSVVQAACGAGQPPASCLQHQHELASVYHALAHSGRHIARSCCNSALTCSRTSGRAQGVLGWAAAREHAAHAARLGQQLRSYAVKGKGGAKAAAAVPVAKKPAATPDQYAPPEWRMKRVPRSPKGGGLAAATPEQRALLERLNPGPTPLRSLRELGWPLGQKQVLALLHDQLGDAMNTNTHVLPFVLGDMYQSAAGLAGMVKDYLAEGRGMPTVEQALLTTIAALPPGSVPFEGIKVQVKGRLSGKGGMTSKRSWTWGRTSTANISDPVDYAHEAVITRAGYIGIKVWVRYKRSHMEAQKQHSSRSLISVAELLAMPAPAALPSRSSSAWWAVPGPLQPRVHRAWQCYKPSYDPLTATDKLIGPAAAAATAAVS